MSEESKTPEEEIAELEELRAKKKADTGKAREARYAKDLRAIMAIETERSVSLSIMRLPNYVEGLPVAIAVSTPEGGVLKRYTDQVNAAVNGGHKPGAKPGLLKSAIEQLGRSCWVYPAEQSTRDQMIEQWPAILGNAGTAAQKLSEIRSEEEGKE